MITGLPSQIIAPTASRISQKSSFFSITCFLLRIELVTLRSGYRKPTLTRRLTLISALYDKRFVRYAKKFENRVSETLMALHHLIFMTSQKAKVLCAEFFPKTPPPDIPGILKYQNSEIMKLPTL